MNACCMSRRSPSARRGRMMSTFPLRRQTASQILSGKGYDENETDRRESG